MKQPVRRRAHEMQQKNHRGKKQEGRQDKREMSGRQVNAVRAYQSDAADQTDIFYFSQQHLLLF
ncbi:MAG: hypothetical protein WAJ99_22010 [Candidatus Sulfotelmatobacter sp.]